MSTSTRQNSLFVSEDWTKIYQTFRDADFQSYDYETLRSTMVQYLRNNYPEDFNDYIESSEFVALMDLIAYFGQSLAFRQDLNARENFLETAQRRDSVLRLAKLLSYQPKRNQPARGMLKVVNIQTTENVYDSSGRNLAEILRLLDSIQLTAKHPVATPVNWNPGGECIIAPSLDDEQAKDKFPGGWKTVKPYLRTIPQPAD